MFVLLPLKLNAPTPRSAAPTANLLIIAANVASFMLLSITGAYWFVGPETGPLSVLLYGFSHAGFWHLLFNMWALWVFGNAVNRRIGNAYYALVYLGTIVALGLVAKFLHHGNVLGASGGIFAIMIVAAVLIPAGRLSVGYGVVFPLSLLLGLLRKPRYGIEWFLAGGTFQVRTLWCLLAIPVLELVSLVAGVLTGYGSIWNLGHLLGMICGCIAVLLLPSRITMGRSRTRVAGMGW